MILVASVRDGRKSDRVGRFFMKFISGLDGCAAHIVDLRDYDFPVFHERLKYQKDPPEKVRSFAATISGADAVVIVTPEYNGGYPAALKNVTDLLYDEWRRKPVAICTVSSGQFGGSQVITSLLFTLWKIGAWVVPAMFPVPDVEKTFTEDGEPAAEKAEGLRKRATTFTGELLYAIDARRAMQRQ